MIWSIHKSLPWLGLILPTIISASLADESSIYSTEFNYVIVGGGTAGLVVASRLSEDPQISVAVIEAGNFEGNNPNVTTTTALGIAKNTQLDWQYESLPQEFAANQTLIWSAGKGLGGSSLINGMTYMRPASSQIDLWPTLGLEIDWETLFNYSKEGEHFQPPSPDLTALGASYELSAHGFDGPISTCVSPHMTTSDIRNIFNATFMQMGIPPRREFNNGELRGYGIQMVTQDGIADIRDDAARAYYYPVMNRTNLVAIVNTTGTRVVWSSENPDGNAVASAIEVVNQDGETSMIYAKNEIILSAGAIRSPVILENSGIGNPSILSQHSIGVKVDLPSVGENLQDQTTIAIVGATTQLNVTGFPVFVAHTSLEDLFGPDTSSVYESILAKLPGYAATIAAQNGGASSAEAQEFLLKSQLDLLFNSNTPASEIVPLGIETLVGCVFWPLQPFSRGSVHINSTNATAPPAIDAKFFQIDFDGQLSVATARFVRKFLTTPPLSGAVNVSTLVPSLQDIPEDAGDDIWLDWIKTQSSFQPNYHHLGTCAMLPRELGGVVDNDFRVYGTANLRVVDLSVIPLQVAGHSTSLLYGVAEWASQKIKQGV